MLASTYNITSNLSSSEPVMQQNRSRINILTPVFSMAPTTTPAGAHRARREGIYRLPSETDNRDLAAKVRESMRLVAQPMAIITTPVEVEANLEPGRYGQTPLQQEPIVGFVASSFNVVSMADERGPIVSFNLKLPSRSFAAISECGRFDVSFPWSAEVCHSFLRAPPPAATAGDYGMNTRLGSNSGNRNSSGSGGDIKKHNNGSTSSSSSASRSSSTSLAPESNNQRPPPPKRQQSAIAHESDTGELLRLHRTFAYRCEWLQEQSITVADHVIMLGRVTGFVIGDLVDPADVKAEQLPINYRDAKFLKLRAMQHDPSFFEFSVRGQVL